MFKDTQAYSGFSVDNIPKAKAFYSNTLGLEVSEDYGMLRLHIATGAEILVYPKTITFLQPILSSTFR
jgi:catechol 2,3-dioxygenase-like lactoylglutathione lyase family enzyme